MATKYTSKNSILKYAATATPTTTVDNLVEVSITIAEREMIDATSHSSATTKDYLAAPLRDTNEVSGKIIYDPADTIHELMRNHAAAGTKGYATLVLPDAGAAQWAMAGYLTRFSVPTLNAEGKLEVDFTFKADGPDSFTA
jgi:hypothetical protein